MTNRDFPLFANTLKVKKVLKRAKNGCRCLRLSLSRRRVAQLLPANYYTFETEKAHVNTQS